MNDIIGGDLIARTQSRLIDNGPDELVVYNEQEVEDIMEYNKAHRNSIDERAGTAADGELVGKIPLNIVYRLKKAGIWDDDDALLKWLHNPDNVVWKIHPGKFI